MRPGGAPAGTVRRLAEAVRRLGLAGRSVLVAVSGGVDSTALFVALRELAEEQALNLSIGHVNHSLRGAESDADEAAVRGLGGRAGVPVYARRVDPRALREGRSSRERPTLEEAARRVRYQALYELADAAGADLIATAHHADDQAETVLLRLLRGTGPDGLAGIPERSPDGRVVRPLLRVSRREIVAYARARGVDWREDASNADPRHPRNRLRTRWLPALVQDFNPQLLRALCDLAEAQARDKEWIEELVEREARLRFAAEGEQLRIERKDWDALPEALARRLVRLALRRCGAGRDVSRVHLARALAFMKQGRRGACIELPAGLRLTCERSSFRLARAGAPSAGVGPGGAC